MYYSGTKLNTPQTAPEVPEKYPAEVLEPYLPDPQLVKAVNLAILLKRPLLLMGDPGSGKSLAARAVAYELYHDPGNKRDYRNHFHEWNIKSTSKAQDGLYEYDTLRRLRDAQTKDKNLDEDKYITYGALGKALMESTPDVRHVLLIDEIDKADIDFPNDLLNEIDKGSFYIVEKKERYLAKGKPIIIITSNRERELPEAFLRRCIYYFIPKFERPLLEEILKRRFYANTTVDVTLVNRALDVFIQVRDAVEKAKSAGKNISTSELIDWYQAIKFYKELPAKEVEPGLKDAVKEVEEFITTQNFIPLRQALFKNIETLNYFDTAKDGTIPPA